MFFFRTPPLVSKQLDLAVHAYPSLADLAAMGAGFSTDVMCVAGVPVGVDAWVKNFVAKKARAVITDVAKLDAVTRLRWAYSHSTAQFLPKCSYDLFWS